MTSITDTNQEAPSEAALSKRAIAKKLRAGFVLPLAMVARTVGRKEYNEQPKAREEMEKEWNKLRNINGVEGCCAWDEEHVMEWSDVLKSGFPRDKIHIGSLHELCVEKGKRARRKRPEP